MKDQSFTAYKIVCVGRWRAPDGQVVEVTYVADHMGFRLVEDLQTTQPSHTQPTHTPRMRTPWANTDEEEDTEEDSGMEEEENEEEEEGVGRAEEVEEKRLSC